MLSVLNITAPVFFVILVGFLSAKTRAFTAESHKIFGMYVFYCAMPCYLFMAMAKSPIDMIANINYILAFAVALFLTALASWLLCSRLFKLDGSQSILGMMAGSYTNSAFVGIPIIVMAFGEPGPVVVVALFQVVIVTTFILTLLDFYRQHTRISWGIIKNIPKTMISNPIVSGSLLGILVSVFHLEIPLIAQNSLNLLGQAGIPTALFALGLSLGQKQGIAPSTEKNIHIGALVFIKTIVHPLLAYLVGHFIFNLSGHWLGALVIVSAMPTAMNNFVFAQRYNTFTAESSQIVFFSSIVSLFTLSALLWWFI